MRKSKFTEHQIVSILKQQEAGVKVADLCREHGIQKSCSPKCGRVELENDPARTSH